MPREFERQSDGTVKSENDRYILDEGNVGNVWVYNTGYMHSTKDKLAYQHPAIFPERLAKDHIISWSNEGDTVMDCLMGSGTVGVVCKILRRNFIGIEIDPTYFALAKKRIDSTEWGLPFPADGD